MSEIFDPFSVEIFEIPNAKVAIVNKSLDVFKESVALPEREIDGNPYVAWGADDQLPYSILKLIGDDETLSTCQVFNAEICYGSGLKYCTEDADKKVKAEVSEFLDDNLMPDYFLGVSQDLKYFNFAISVIVLNSDGDKIVELHRKPACYCRFAPADEKTGLISKILFSNFRASGPQQPLEVIDLLNPRTPWKDLQQRMGLRARPDGTRHKDATRKYAILSKFPGVDSLYYPIPHYASLFKGPWYKIKRLIGEAKMAKLENSAPLKYIIEISQRYWDDLFAKQHVVKQADKQKLVDAKKREMLEFLTNHTNSGAVLFTGKSIALDGKSENPDVTVSCIDSKNKEGGDWESDIAEAVNMECFTMRVHSNLVGSVPGKAQTNNSGSDKRELYTIAQALQKPYHDILFTVHNIIIRFNKWHGVHPDCPFIQLTTLDEHSDAKRVTANSKNNGSES